MKIVPIFEEKLYAFEFIENLNVLDELLNLWNDPSYLFQFVKENIEIQKGKSIHDIINQIIDDANYIDDLLIEIDNDPKRTLDEFFKPLHNHEFREITLSKQKGRKSCLRIYAIRISKNLFVITGGAIKFHHLNKDKENTSREMQILTICRDYLKSKGVGDDDSFFELINE